VGFFGTLARIAGGVVKSLPGIGTVYGAAENVIKAVAGKGPIPMQPVVQNTDFPVSIDRFYDRQDRVSPMPLIAPPKNYYPGGTLVNKGPARRPKTSAPRRARARPKRATRAAPRKRKSKLKFGSPAWRKKYLTKRR